MRNISLITFYIALSLNAVSPAHNTYIDIPTANFSDGIYLGLDGSYPFESESEVGFDPNIWIGYTRGRINSALKWYNGTEFSLDIAFMLFKGDGYLPNIALGMNDITYSVHISPVGSENTYEDDEYNPRPSEVFSSYIVSTWTVNKYFEMTGGIGRGKFIGYGPLSRYLNLDILFDEKHEDVIFGFFGGIKLEIPNGPAFIMETSGRDLNLGFHYEFSNFKGILGLSKIETFFAEEGHIVSPRFFAGFSYKFLTIKRDTPGKLYFVITDDKTGDKISSSAIIQSDGRRIVIEIIPDKENFTKLKPGVYMITLVAPGYLEKRFRVDVNPGGEHYIASSLTKSQN